MLNTTSKAMPASCFDGKIGPILESNSRMHAEFDAPNFCLTILQPLLWE